MTRSSLLLTVTVGLSVVPSSLALAACPSGMVESGSTCMDKYEASVSANFKPQCIQLIKRGANLPPSCFGGAVEVAIQGSPIPLPCKPNGSGCTNIFALSLPGVIPAHQVQYFLAAAACRNSGKRLPSNAEWQAAALGTPDPWPQTDPANQCNLNSPSVALTGSHKFCVSDVRAFDMVGNVIEIVADWGPLATAGTNWDVFLPGFGGDVSNMGGSPPPPDPDPQKKVIYGLPGATIRGGSFNITPDSGGNGERAGVYAIDQNGAPNSPGNGTASGFRCATNVPGK